MNGDPVELLKKVIAYFNLHPEMDDYEKIHESIVRDTVFKGTNLWILVFAIIVASVGLNMNSTAVIIGAMLISPLMGPINGMGYSIATYNFELFRQSVRNFSFAVIAALVASTLYFFVSPIATAHSELLARTSPTIYDVLIALFGGMAGVIAISSKQKGNVIPGVAIATALMPPLCTAGYGLATGQLNFFFGAIYLFTINTVFIALSSVAISQILKFPLRTIIGERQKKKVNRLISTVIFLVIVPSIYFGYGLVLKEKFAESANRYVSNVQTFEGNYLLNHEVDPDTRSITLTYGGVRMSDAQKRAIEEKAADFRLTDVSVVIRQGLSIYSSDESKVAEVYLLREKLGKIEQIAATKQAVIDSLNQRRFTGRTLLNELKPLFPQVESCSYAESIRFFNGSDNESIILVTLSTKSGVLSMAEREKIRKWLVVRLDTDKVNLVVE
ncbi:MAG TPA: TIGR00341 family protein [Bacteroidales bacterium]|nr:MAG: TIGR00341 family protein [Bacteroidetes bacterium GWE2_42_24]OFY31068.1 MAG: TIGR00341 family protein [Bacteroidetes bacterium GWF2_43_11]HAQ64645.1 TIGR00341 family protein [Bacteroidales bacterium]HBZ66575.1 TIGR00341 family protein [Bacteroidales bacterium]